MISQKLINVIKENNEIKEFFSNTNEVDVLIKNLNINELERFYIEYPNFLEMKKSSEIPSTILCLTFIKRDLDVNSYTKVKKIKIYIDQMTDKIIKILIILFFHQF